MSSAGENSSNFPTMIIPKGTEIRLNEEGQLSIKTPGNLVIQNSGNYSEIESTNGSIRIEENVKVDAVSVRAGQACFIQGTLTAWRVNAKKIALEDRARAYIMLQESESLDLSPTSRLVGNFANEKEVYLLLGKFSRQLRQLPGAVGMAALEDDEVAPESGEKAIDALTGAGRAAEDVTRGMSRDDESESMPRKPERASAPQKSTTPPADRADITRNLTFTPLLRHIVATPAGDRGQPGVYGSARPAGLLPPPPQARHQPATADHHIRNSTH
ncbi:MAG: hypothetical protein KY432_06855, partial [Acidobacteria bacterium]|nr:hypothetical protein [Acidobacteriota bacterium]